MNITKITPLTPSTQGTPGTPGTPSNGSLFNLYKTSLLIKFFINLKIFYYDQLTGKF